MKVTKYILGFCCAGACVMGVASVAAQQYPFKSIRIVTAVPGGGTDFLSRSIAQAISGPLGQQVIVDNRPSGVTQADIVAKATADGHTVLSTSNILWVGPLLQRAPYDPIRDFSPITLAASSPAVLLVNPLLPVKSVKDLIVLARGKPGALNYGSAGAGGSTHLPAELFKSMAGVNIVLIPYKGSGPAITALIGNEVQIMFSTGGSAAPHIKSGRVRALAVTSAKPSALFPEYPTVAASGLPGYESDVIYGVFAPSKTPASAVTRLNSEIVQALGNADLRARLFVAGLDVVASSPAELGAEVKADMARTAKVIKDAGIRAE